MPLRTSKDIHGSSQWSHEDIKPLPDTYANDQLTCPIYSIQEVPGNNIKHLSEFAGVQ